MSEGDSSPLHEKMSLAGVSVTVSRSNAGSSTTLPTGVTFLLPGAMIKISEYNSTRDIILEMDQWVISFFVNVMWPIPSNHRKQTEKVKNIFDAFRSIHPEIPDRYNIVGHSVGAEIALLAASLVDPLRVSKVLALDPVDQVPTEFTKKRGSNLPLDETSAITLTPADGGDIIQVDNHRSSESQNDDCTFNAGHRSIILTLTDGGMGISKAHNAQAIHNLNPKSTNLIHHEHSGHMAYTDHGGGLASFVMPDVGTKEGNKNALLDAHKLIRILIGGP